MTRLSQEPVLEFFVVRSSTGLFFKNKGYGGYSKKSWVEDIRDARVYTKVGHAKAQATWWLQNYPENGVPEVVILEARIAGTTKTKVCDKMNKEHAKALAVVSAFDSDIAELEATIMESSSDVVRKSLGHQVDALRAKRKLADKQASGLSAKISRMNDAMRQHQEDSDGIEG